MHLITTSNSILESKLLGMAGVTVTIVATNATCLRYLQCLLNIAL